MRTSLRVAVAVVLLSASIAQAQTGSAPKSIPELVKETAPSVVNITQVNAAGKPTSYGSGFIASADGIIVTALHVIRGAAAVAVKTSDGEIYDDVGVVQFDVRRDLAVLKIKPFRPLTPLRLAETDEVNIGESTSAIGNPQGLDASVSAGIISGYRQAEGFRMLQTTAPVSPGSSGGPLFSAAGEVIGIVTSGVSNTQGQNLNFAVPVLYLRPMLASPNPATPVGEFSRKLSQSPLAAVAGDVGAGVDASAAWRVQHGHSDDFRLRCYGTLAIVGANLRFVSNDPSESWERPLSSVAEVKKNQSVGLDYQAFHVRFKDRLNFNFSVTNDSGRPTRPDEVVLILRGLTNR